MKLLFVNNIPFNPIAGGIERVTDVLAKELIKRGHIVYYLCAKIDASGQCLLNYDYPAKLYQLPYEGLFENEQNVAFYKKLQAELQIDVVVNQRGHIGSFNNLLPHTFVKLVSVIHSTPDKCWAMFINESLDSKDSLSVKFKKSIRKIFPSIVTYYWKQIIKNRYRELAKYSDIIVTLSKKDIKKVENFLTHNLCKAKIHSIPNLNTYNVPGLQLQYKEKIVLYVGRLDKIEKNPIRLLKIWGKLYDKNPDWRLVFVGDGGEKENMLAFVKEHQLNNVSFMGNKGDVSEYYKKASFICLTSNYEGWGMVLTEGMQYGCIPFTFNNYGAAYEIIDDGINGCLIPAYNLNKYAFRLSELMLDEERRYRMSMAAIEKVKIFSSEIIADKWDMLFRSLL